MSFYYRLLVVEKYLEKCLTIQYETFILAGEFFSHFACNKETSEEAKLLLKTFKLTKKSIQNQL